MDIENLVGRAWLDGIDGGGSLDPKRAKARAALIRIFADVKNPYRFLTLLRKAGHSDIAAGIVSSLGPVAAPLKRERSNQPTFDFELSGEDN